ncbi:hypothetical protein IRJ41_005760 [Triplophysa rosa]|uniref:Uncharacterized protein n=1 Tax=Triplophysa rosa TaxID=992332 RepID=A0A9W7X2L8_TRIRA|nr:hypothetical protein IRJ41_005760 [Triplophysa rosa]
MSAHAAPPSKTLCGYVNTRYPKQMPTQLFPIAIGAKSSRTCSLYLDFLCYFTLLFPQPAVSVASDLFSVRSPCCLWVPSPVAVQRGWAAGVGLTGGDAGRKRPFELNAAKSDGFVLSMSPWPPALVGYRFLIPGLREQKWDTQKTIESCASQSAAGGDTNANPGDKL